MSEVPSGNPDPLTTSGGEIAGLLAGLIQPINPLQDIQRTVGATPTIDERISAFVDDILPTYIGEDHPTFTLFMKAFYEFLEKESGTRYEAVKLQTTFDLDETFDNFITYFMDQYAANFPKDLDIGMSDRQLVKRVNQFYKDKGGSISVKLLFRMIFGKEADIKYPREKLFEVSGGEFLSTSLMKVSRTNTVQDLEALEGGLVRQYPNDEYGSVNRYASPSATGLIDSIQITTIEGIDQATLQLKDVKGVFSPNAEVDLVKGSTLLQEGVFELIGGITVSAKGFSYDVGDAIEVKDSRGFVITTTSVESIEKGGAIKSLSPVSVESVYRPYETYSFDIASLAGENATFSLVNGYGNLPVKKVRQTQRSTLSSNSVIQDNFRNQQFSYVIRVEEQLKTFKKIVLDVLHPAGSKLFNDHIVNRKFSATTFDFSPPNVSTTSSNPIRFAPAIGHFTPYTFNGTADLRGETYGTTHADYYPTGFNGLTAATAGLFASGEPVTHDPITAGFTIGAMGGPTAGTLNPEAFGYTFSVNAGVTLPGYTVENIDQKIQVTGTDSITAPFWIIYKHPKNSLIDPPPSGIASSRFENFPLDSDGFSFAHFGSFTTGISTGDTLVQRSPDRQTAIGIVSGITTQNPLSDQRKFAAVNTKGGTVGILLTINVRSGEFTNQENTDGTQRLLLNTRNGATFATLGTGGNLSVQTTSGGIISRFAWTDLNIGDFLNKTIY